MKITLTIFLLIFFASSAHAETVRVYTDYSPVKILRIVGENSDFDIEAGKAGLKGDFEEIDDSEIPTDRTYRDAWKFSGRKISVDARMKSDIDTERGKRTSAIAKLKGLGLTDEDLSALRITEA